MVCVLIICVYLNGYFHHSLDFTDVYFRHDELRGNLMVNSD